MTGTRADKAPPRLTNYAIFRTAGVDDPSAHPLWTSAGEIEAHGAQDAIRRWANGQGESFTGGPIMAIPYRSVTVAQVKVETRRQLTLGAP